MTIAEWMILAAVLIYLLTLAPFKPLGYRDFDNAKPRDAEFWATPLRSRALGAHINGIETFPFFAAAVLLAEFRASPQHLIDELAVAFIVLRLAFVAAYLLNYPWTRTLIWNLGFAVNVAIFIAPLWAR
jgi:uncharacterized MAPEG superfamily protein